MLARRPDRDGSRERRVRVACVQTVYTLRYARIYFTDPIGGLAFREGDSPESRLGVCRVHDRMTFQVSDIEISTRAMSRPVIRYACSRISSAR